MEDMERNEIFIDHNNVDKRRRQTYHGLNLIRGTKGNHLEEHERDLYPKDIKRLEKEKEDECCSGIFANRRKHICKISTINLIRIKPL